MKAHTFKLISTIFAWLISATVVFSQYIIPIRTLSIPPTIDKINFDGKDNESSYSVAQTLSNFDPIGYNGENDFSGYFKVCWDSRFIYFFANITDDINNSYPNSDGYNEWMFDNIEIYLDLDTSGNGNYYGDYTVQLRYNRGWNMVMWSGRAEKGDFFCNLQNKSDSTGWFLETAIPWTCVLPKGSLPEDINEFIGKHIGFDVIFSDSDLDPYYGMRDVQSSWDMDAPDDATDRTEDNAWNNRKVFGIVDLFGTPISAPTETPPPPPPPPPFVNPPPPPPPVGSIEDYVQPIATMSIPATKDTINFDGIDNELSYSEAQLLTTFNYTGVSGDEDFSGYFKVCWDKTYLYLFAKITDDVNYSNLYGGNDWDFDNIELYIDLDTNSTSTWYDENSIQIRFNREWQRVSWTGRATADDFYYYSSDTPEKNGWVVESAIPWTSVMPSGSLPEDFYKYIGNIIGFDVMGGDSDGYDLNYGFRDGQSAWDMDYPNDTIDRTEDCAWNNTRVFGIIQLLGNPIISPPPPPPAPPGPNPGEIPPGPSVPPSSGSNFVTPIKSMHIPKSYETMIIDGTASENSYSDDQNLEVFNSTGLDGSSDDFNGYFKVCWDNNYLYFFADVTDDINHSVFEDINAWMFDNIELYIDLAIDSVNVAYDENTIQLRFNRGNDNAMWPGRASREEFIYYWANKPDSTGWIVETAVPWTAVLPEGKNSEDILEYINYNMGFDVVFSDSDGDDPGLGMRDAMMAWDMDDPNNVDDRTEDNAWNNTHVFGIINLMSEVVVPIYEETDDRVSTEPTVLSDETIVYPNPAHSNINFENLNNIKTIEILNMLGQTIREIMVTDKTITVNISELPPDGIVFIRYNYTDGKSKVRKLILK